LGSEQEKKSKSMDSVRFKLSAEFWLRRPCNDRVAFLSIRNVVILKGKFVEIPWEKLFSLLDRQKTTEEILQSLWPLSPEVVKSLLGELEKLEVVQKVEDAAIQMGETLHLSESALQVVDLEPNAEWPVSLPDRLKTLCNKSNGIVQRIERIEVEKSEPKIFQFRLKGFTNLRSRPYRFIAIGKGLREHEAVESGVGEAVERYSVGVCEEEYFTRASFEQIKANALDPRVAINFTRDQYATQDFPYVPFSETQEYYWMSSECVTQGRKVFIPAQFIFVPMPAKAEPILWKANTSGCAAGLTNCFSILKALLEVIERDALMLNWYSCRCCRKIEVEDGDCSLVNEALERIRSRGLNSWCFALETEFKVPVCLALIVDYRSHRPLISVGCAAMKSWVDAIYKAVIEAIQVRTALRSREKKERNLHDACDVRRSWDHAFYYYDHIGRLEAFRFLFESQSIKLKELESPFEGYRDEAAIDRCIERVYAAGYDVYVVDLTPREIKELGYHVVRVLVPGLIPLHFGHNTLPLGLTRLGGSLGEIEMSQLKWPHPFT